MSKDRISYIDMVKGIGMILVLTGHSCFPSQNVITWLASFHMPLFFIVSGMMFSHTRSENRDWKQFVIKRIKGILIPYAVFSALSILSSVIVDYKSFPEYLIILLIQTMSFYGISVLWFLPALFFGEIIFFFTKKKTNKLVTLIIVFVIAVISILGNELYHRFYAFQAGYIDLLTGYVYVLLIRIGFAVSFLAIGYFIHDFLHSKKIPGFVYIILGAIFLSINIWIGFKNGRVDLNQVVFGNYVFYYIAAISGSLAIICICKPLPEIKPLSAIGKNSLIIMGTHINCRYYGICYMLGDFILIKLPFLGKIGYMFITVSIFIILEIITIYIVKLLKRKKKRT